jgi:peptide deformylase
MDAVCIQHEIDHLNGKLFIDRLSFFRKLALRSRLRAKVRRHNNAA